MNFTKEELDNEIWKDVLRYDYEYQISNLGRFKRVTSFHKNNKGEITVGSLDSRGYLRTNLTKEGKNISKKLHRLVAEHFLDNYSEDLTVNHIDFNKSNNKLSNLEMMTVKENVIDYITKKKKLKTYSSVIGVSYHKTIKKWVAKLGRLHLGVYDTENEAIDVIKNCDENFIKKKKKGDCIRVSEDTIKNILYLKNRVYLNQIAQVLDLSITTIYKYAYKPPFELDTNYEPERLEIKNLKRTRHVSGKEHHRFKEKVGKEFINKEGFKYTIIKYYDKLCDIEFQDGNIITGLQYDWVRKSRVKNKKYETTD